MTFILSTFEIHIEYHSDDENHFHLVLVNGHSQIAFRFPRERDIAIVAKVSTRKFDSLSIGVVEGSICAFGQCKGRNMKESDSHHMVEQP